jgi:5-formyltetrahydrofolate cyclo-ligase
MGPLRDTMDQITLKKELRTELLQKRMELSPEKVTLYSRQIFERWRNRFSLKRVGFFHVFQSMPQKHEVQTKDFMDFVRERHPQVHLVVPVVDNINKVLRHAYVHEDVEMRVNRWGIPEPHMAVDFIHPMQMDVVIVPLLGFDDRGHRLGYGAGYYDRFLALTRPACMKVGLCFECGHLSKPLPSEPHDIPLDFVVTENTIIRFNPNFLV